MENTKKETDIKTNTELIYEKMTIKGKIIQKINPLQWKKSRKDSFCKEKSEKSTNLDALSTCLTLKSPRLQHYTQKKSDKTLKETPNKSSRRTIKYGWKSLAFLKGGSESQWKESTSSTAETPTQNHKKRKRKQKETKRKMSCKIPEAPSLESRSLSKMIWTMREKELLTVRCGS